VLNSEISKVFTPYFSQSTIINIKNDDESSFGSWSVTTYFQKLPFSRIQSLGATPKLGNLASRNSNNSFDRPLLR